MKLTRKQLSEIKSIWQNLTTKELYNHLMVNFALNTGYTSFRTALYKEGFKKCKILRWTEKETQFLIDNYKTKGNIELAKLLSKKDRKFTKKNVEKKIKLLGIKRTKDDLTLIREDHKKAGVYSEANRRMWKKRGAKDGEMRVWFNNSRPVVVIKVNGSFCNYARHRYMELHDSVPKGCKVFFKDGNFMNLSDDNFIAKPSLNREERKQYKRNIEKYLLEKKSENFQPIEIPKVQIPEEPKLHLISVRINRKLTVKVKPGTDIEKLKSQYKDRIDPSQFVVRNANLKMS